MRTQPEALRLADALEAFWGADIGHDRERQAAAELRRLHGVEFALRDCKKTLEGMAKKYMDAADQRDALLEALKAMLENGQDYTATRDKARAAIAKAEGEKT